MCAHWAERVGFKDKAEHVCSEWPCGQVVGREDPETLISSAGTRQTADGFPAQTRMTLLLQGLGILRNQCHISFENHKNYFKRLHSFWREKLVCIYQRTRVLVIIQGFVKDSWSAYRSLPLMSLFLIA